MTALSISDFQKIVNDYYHTQGRDLPWRQSPNGEDFNAYHILVSEFMLQQTGVNRVIPKYQAFIRKFPTITDLANASLADVLRMWSGLGYNRRAKYIHQTAHIMAFKNQPWQYDDLRACPGIGPNTAAAILVYAYNQPLVFVETNIRTVFIHHFFQQQTAIADKDLRPLIRKALDSQQPRSFYWALMDYGTYLKTQSGNAAQRSKHYIKQSRFEGSKRQLRGQVIRLLSEAPRDRETLKRLLSDKRAEQVISELCREQLIAQRGKSYHLAGT